MKAGNYFHLAAKVAFGPDNGRGALRSFSAAMVIAVASQSWSQPAAMVHFHQENNFGGRQTVRALQNGTFCIAAALGSELRLYFINSDNVVVGAYQVGTPGLTARPKIEVGIDGSVFLAYEYGAGLVFAKVSSQGVLLHQTLLSFPGYAQHEVRELKVTPSGQMVAVGTMQPQAGGPIRNFLAAGTPQGLVSAKVVSTYNGDAMSLARSSDGSWFMGLRGGFNTHSALWKFSSTFTSQFVKSLPGLNLKKVLAGKQGEIYVMGNSTSDPVRAWVMRRNPANGNGLWGWLPEVANPTWMVDAAVDGAGQVHLLHKSNGLVPSQRALFSPQGLVNTRVVSRPGYPGRLAFDRYNEGYFSLGDSQLEFYDLVKYGAGSLGSYRFSVPCLGTAQQFPGEVAVDSDSGDIVSISESSFTQLRWRIFRQAPQARADAASVVTNSNSLIPILVNDRFASKAQVVIVSPPSFGTASVVGGQVQYRSNAGYVGPDSLTYRLIRPGVSTSDARVTLTVTGS